MTVLTQKSQVTIPKKIRELAGLSPGEEIEFEAKGSYIVLRKKGKTIMIEKYRGILGTGKTENIMQELR